MAFQEVKVVPILSDIQSWKELEEAFGTSDANEIAKRIVKNGEVKSPVWL